MTCLSYAEIKCPVILKFALKWVQIHVKHMLRSIHQTHNRWIFGTRRGYLPGIHWYCRSLNIDMVVYVKVEQFVGLVFVVAKLPPGCPENASMYRASPGASSRQSVALLYWQQLSVAVPSGTQFSEFPLNPKLNAVSAIWWLLAQVNAWVAVLM